MSDLCRLIWCALIGIFRPRAALQAEILVLRHQLIVLRRKSPKRLAFGNIDRLVFTALYHVAPGLEAHNADWLPDETPVRALCDRMVCTACGLIGADVRPDWSAHTNRPS
jgi:hypothetical protein